MDNQRVKDVAVLAATMQVKQSLKDWKECIKNYDLVEESLTVAIKRNIPLLVQKIIEANICPKCDSLNVVISDDKPRQMYCWDCENTWKGGDHG